MSYKIEAIEGIGQVYAAELRRIGVDTTDDLLEMGATRAGRKELAEKTGISPSLIMKFVNHADLFRVKGVAGQFAELLEAAGVDTVKEFRHRVAANLRPKMEEVNERRHICGRVPSVEELQRMIDDAAGLEPVVVY